VDSNIQSTKSSECLFNSLKMNTRNNRHEELFRRRRECKNNQMYNSDVPVSTSFSCHLVPDQLKASGTFTFILLSIHAGIC